jgi:hypothetical protein
VIGRALQIRDSRLGKQKQAFVLVCSIMWHCENLGVRCRRSSWSQA